MSDNSVEEIKEWLALMDSSYIDFVKTEVLPDDDNEYITVGLSAPDNELLKFKITPDGTILNENGEDVVEVAINANDNDPYFVEDIKQFRADWYHQILKHRIYEEDEDDYATLLDSLIIEKDLSVETVRDIMNHFDIAGSAEHFVKSAKEDYARDKAKKDEFNNLLWNILKTHFGHTVEIAVYGDLNDPADVCLEDMDTGEVILDAELYTIIARDDNE